MRVTTHFQYLRTHDPEFVANWANLRPTHRLGLWRLVRQAEDIRRSFRTREALFKAHRDASARAAAALRGLPQIDFQRKPAPLEWMAIATDRKRMDGAFELWNWRLQSFLSRHSHPCARFYGGVKPQASINQKLREHLNGKDLDLWDGVRFRIVAPDLLGIMALGDLFLSDFSSEIIRCRNYYHRPRNGEADAYRAIHIELEDRPYNYVEVQMLTATREAIGLFDHTLRKGVLKFQSQDHAFWLDDLSYACNVWDAVSLSRNHPAAYP